MAVQFMVFPFGMIFLCCLVGVLFSFFVHVPPSSDAGGSTTISSSDQHIRKELAEQDIPERIIDAVIAGKSIGESKLAQLTPKQRAEIQNAQTAISLRNKYTQMFTLGCVALVMAVAGVIFSLGLLLWIKRKTVLQCGVCKVITPAS